MYTTCLGVGTGGLETGGWSGDTQTRGWAPKYICSTYIMNRKVPLLCIIDNSLTVLAVLDRYWDAHYGTSSINQCYYHVAKNQTVFNSLKKIIILPPDLVGICLAGNPSVSISLFWSNDWSPHYSSPPPILCAISAQTKYIPPVFPPADQALHLWGQANCIPCVFPSAEQAFHYNGYQQNTFLVYIHLLSTSCTNKGKQNTILWYFHLCCYQT